MRFVIDQSTGTISAIGTASIGTSVLGLFGYTELALVSESSAEHAQAQITPGGPGGSNLEVAVMLDVTGSMCDDGIGPCQSGAKMDGLKAAATDLINIVVKADQSQYTSRVALVPFATKIRVGRDNGGPAGEGAQRIKTLTNLDPTWTGLMHDCILGAGDGGSENAGDWHCLTYADVTMTNWNVMPCVTERFYETGSVFDITDDVPGPGHWLGAHDGSRTLLSWDSSDTPLVFGDGTGVAGDPASTWNYNSDGTCGDIADGNIVMPLSSNKSDLLNRLSDLQGFGGTAGAVGTSWAWYMLSPNWSNVWGGDGVAGSYADLTTLQDTGAPVLRKVAVLMTDGGYNAFRAGKERDQQTVSDYAMSVCSAMKAQGIEIYTVGFALDQLTDAEATIARQTLRTCGSDVSHFYESLDIPQLRTAFQSIGSQMSGLRLTQ